MSTRASLLEFCHTLPKFCFACLQRISNSHQPAKSSHANHFVATTQKQSKQFGSIPHNQKSQEVSTAQATTKPTHRKQMISRTGAHVLAMTSTLPEYAKRSEWRHRWSAIALQVCLRNSVPSTKRRRHMQQLSRRCSARKWIPSAAGRHGVQKSMPWAALGIVRTVVVVANESKLKRSLKVSTKYQVYMSCKCK